MIFVYICSENLIIFFLKKQYIYACLCAVSVSLFSCKDANEYSVNADFATYVQRFEDEAASRGRVFDLKSSGLIIEYGNLDKDVAGLTHYEKPIRIEIDKDYWNTVGKYAGADIMREDLIFHEMGHGILNRRHTNAVLANDEWKSIMCGGDSVPGRTWNINYRGIRRNYYLDELFNESTPSPDFASSSLPIDTTGYTVFYTENFNNAASSTWKTGDFTDYSTSISNGVLNLTSKKSMNLILIVRNNSLNVQSDFIFECTFQFTGTNLTDRYGFIFGTNPTETEKAAGATESLDYFFVNNEKKMTVGNRNWYSYFTQLTKNQILPKGKNVLKAVKKGTMVYYFINNEYVYCSEIENQKPGSDMGFMIPPLGTIYLDNLRLAQKGTIGSALRTKSLTPPQQVIIETLGWDTVDRKVKMK